MEVMVLDDNRAEDKLLGWGKRVARGSPAVLGILQRLRCSRVMEVQPKSVLGRGWSIGHGWLIKTTSWTPLPPRSSNQRSIRWT
jgi:hypothetical protein